MPDNHFATVTTEMCGVKKKIIFFAIKRCETYLRPVPENKL